jgi:hypothetical protein
VARQRLKALEAASPPEAGAPSRDWARTTFLEFADLVMSEPLSPVQRVLCKIAFEA